MTKTEDNIAVYVGTYSKYNNGSIQGAWVDLTEFDNKEDFYEHCAEIHSDEKDPEFMFQDFEGFPEAYYGESGLHSDLWKYLKTIQTEDKEIIDTLIENGFECDTEYNLIENAYSNVEESIGYYYLFEAGCYEIPSYLENYIDCQKFGRDLTYDFTFLECNGDIIQIVD